MLRTVRARLPTLQGDQPDHAEARSLGRSRSAASMVFLQLSLAGDRLEALLLGNRWKRAGSRGPLQRTCTRPRPTWSRTCTAGRYPDRPQVDLNSLDGSSLGRPPARSSERSSGPVPHPHLPQGSGRTVEDSRAMAP